MFEPKHVRLGAAIAEIPGHFRVALDLYAGGDAHGALMHVKHALIEVLPVVHDALGEEDPIFVRLSRSLAAAGAAIRDQKGPKEVNSTFEAVNEVGAKAISAYVGDEATSPAYRASVVAALLESAAVDYEEAGRINEPRQVYEYQDVRGFILQSRRMLEGLLDASAHPVAEIEERFDRLESMVPSLEVPVEPVPGAEFHAEIEWLRASLQTTLSAELDADPTMHEILEKVKALLARVAEHYGSGQGPVAAREAARAFVNHYLQIADRAKDKNPDVAGEIEQVLGRDLRIKINEGADAGEIQALVDEVNELLEKLEVSTGPK